MNESSRRGFMRSAAAKTVGLLALGAASARDGAARQDPTRCGRQPDSYKFTNVYISGHGDYKFSVGTDDMIKKCQEGASCNDGDYIERKCDNGYSTAFGSVTGGTDGYTYSGQVGFIQLSGDYLTLEFDSGFQGTSRDRVSVASDRSTKYDVNYKFKVTGSVYGEVGNSVEDSDIISGEKGVGYVNNGKDIFKKNGQVKFLQVEPRSSIVTFKHYRG